MRLLVYITLPASFDPAEFCGSLVRDSLAAGMNIAGPARSVYRWKGEVHNEEEWIIFAQVDEASFEEFMLKAKERHPYKTPCIAALPLIKGYPPFMEWIGAAGWTD